MKLIFQKLKRNFTSNFNIELYKAIPDSLENHKNNELHYIKCHTKLPNLHY